MAAKPPTDADQSYFSSNKSALQSQDTNVDDYSAVTSGKKLPKRKVPKTTIRKKVGK